MEPHLKSLSPSRKHRPAPARRQGGWTLVQTAIAMAIGAIAVGVAVAQFARINSAARVENHATDVRDIVAAAQGTFGSTNQYASVTTAVAVQANVFPRDRRITGTATAQSRYSGLWTLAPITLVATNDALRLTDPNVKGSDCVRIVQALEQQMRRITVAGTIVKALDAPVTVGTLATQCDSAENVIILWDFGRGA